MKSFPWLFGLLLILLLVTPQAKAQEQVYTVGIVPQFEARKIRRIWQPIINYLKQETGYHFIIKGSPTIGEFEQELFRGEFDFAYMNPLHLVIGNKNEGYIPLLRDVDRTLQGILVVKKDSTIKNVNQLAGQTIAFPAPHALGASILIRQALEDQFNLEFKPRYAKSHDSVYLNVLLGKTRAGGGVLQTLDRQSPEYKAQLRVIYTTREVPSHPIAVLPTVPKEVAKAVQQALLKLGKSPEGKQLLRAIPIERIDTTSLNDYAPLKTMGLERFYKD